MTLKDRLSRFMASRNCTLLGVGAVSKNVVDSTIELAGKHDVPLILIASRRQIECEMLGRGYVNNWSTEEFGRYVREHDKKRKVLLARDHGGPWQNPFEIDRQYSSEKALVSSKVSFLADLESQFDIIHIDPSIDIFKKPDIYEVIEKVCELYAYCVEVSRSRNQDVLFEVGTDEHDVKLQDMEQFHSTLGSIKRFCTKHGFQMPSFMVAQTGTKVMETGNVGPYEAALQSGLPSKLNELQLPQILKAVANAGMWLKMHNADYLEDSTLALQPKLGIHAANVAPEFGVTESRALVRVLADYNLKSILDRFLELAYNSRKWEKWALPNTTIKDFDKSVIAGHYIFASQAFAELKLEAEAELSKKGIDLDGFLKDQIKACIFRYMKAFNLVGHPASVSPAVTQDVTL